MESQSRYSIVANLTRQKLDILDAKNNLSGDIKVIEQDISNKENDLKNWNTDVEADIKRTRRIKEREIEVAKTGLKQKQDRVEDKEKHCDNKIKQIDNALTAIQKISETAPTAKEQS